MSPPDLHAVINNPQGGLLCPPRAPTLSNVDSRFGRRGALLISGNDESTELNDYFREYKQHWIPTTGGTASGPSLAPLDVAKATAGALKRSRSDAHLGEPGDSDEQAVPTDNSASEHSNESQHGHKRVRRASDSDALDVGPQDASLSPRLPPGGFLNDLISFRVVTILAQSITLSVHKSHTVDHIKQLVGQASTMDPRIMVLVHDNAPLDSSKSLDDLGILSGSIMLARYPKACISVCAKPLSGGPGVTMVMNVNDTLETLKSTLAMRAGLPSYSTRVSETLVLMSPTCKILASDRDSVSLGDLGIASGAILTYAPL